jgi:undecaprenyl-phosphate 4-deoxy-4-formamido-L-arabinose transferase
VSSGSLLSAARNAQIAGTTADESISVSVVVPCYQDELGLPALFGRLGPILDDIEGTPELVLVDDGSNDLTYERAVALAEDFGHPTTVVRLARNFGQHAAVFGGLSHARGKVVVTLDSDLQYLPEEIPLLLEHLSPQYPVVSGYRRERHDPWARRLVTRALTRFLNKRTGASLKDFGSMFRAYDRRVVNQMLAVTERHRYVPAVVASLGARVKEVPVTHHARGDQGSRYRLSGLVAMAMDLVTGYTVFPLRIVTFAGIAASMIGLMATVAFAAYRVLEGSGPSGTVSAFALMFFLSGTQLVIVALIGEYVGRIYTEAKGRPYFVVADRFENST